jgi:hypothetical protein
MNSVTLEGLVGSGELWLDIMRIICGDTGGKSMLDACCHKAPYTSKLGFSERTYVDIQDRPLDDPNEQKYFIKADIVEYLVKTEHVFDVAICSDAVEHFSFSDGYNLIWLMSFKSYKTIFFTPLGACMIQNKETNDPDAHRTGWIPEMFEGYLSIVLPNFHPTIKSGAFFSVLCNPIETTRIYNEIKSKYVEDRID